VLPEIVHWNFWSHYLKVSVDGNGIIQLQGSLEACFRIFLESDGILDSKVEGEPKKSKIWKEDYPKLCVV
jgi:hypothetical protein